MMDTERYCETLDNLDPVKAVQAIQAALMQFNAIDRGLVNLDNSDVKTRLVECLRDAGHIGTK